MSHTPNIRSSALFTIIIGRYDEVHPSEQSDRVVAREIANAITRDSMDYITWIL